MALADAIALFRRWVWILRKHGLLPFIKQGFLFLIRRPFSYQTFYLYRIIVDNKLDEVQFTPRIHNFVLKIVSTNQQLDKLAADYPALGSPFIKARQRLDKGAIAFCFFVGGELAHIGWVAMSEEAKNTFDPLPYQVDFANKEACRGSWTNPKYRGTGLMTYGYFKSLQFLRERGIVAARSAVATSNIASQRVHAKFSPKIYAKARYLKILWWKFWKETPLTQ